MKFFRYIRDMMRFISLPPEQRRITFYSEGKNYWPHLEGLINELLKNSDFTINYITSGSDDPGMALKHKNLNTFLIDEGYIRNWLFENIETDLMVMTMPDLHQYQVKRSKHPVHYVYVQHSLVSLHMVYRPGAFDHFDTIFCAGPHHIKEVRAMESKYNLPEKNLVEHGYARLDSIISNKNIQIKKDKAKGRHALIAPTWGGTCTIESGVAARIVDQLLNNGEKVTLRPHPETIKFSKNKIDIIVDKHKTNPLFSFEDNVAGQQSLHDSDYMISDWSGAALDYSFGLGKPVIFIDVPKKINNPDYMLLEIEPFESSIRKLIGRIVKPDSQVFDLEVHNIDATWRIDDYIFNPSRSAKSGSEWLLAFLKQRPLV